MIFAFCTHSCSRNARNVAYRNNKKGRQPIPIAAPSGVNDRLRIRRRQHPGCGGRAPTQAARLLAPTTAVPDSVAPATAVSSLPTLLKQLLLLHDVSAATFFDW
jgi:hypothetical protein